jgi:hypothetical protein
MRADEPSRRMGEDELLLEVLCLPDGSVNWSVTCVAEQWGSEEAPEGPLYFDSQERTIQIVSPESVGLRTIDLVNYVLAENRYQEFCELHVDGNAATADALQQAVHEQFARIQTALDTAVQMRV